MNRTFIAIMLLSVSNCQAGANVAASNNTTAQSNDSNPIVRVSKTFVDGQSILVAYRADGTPTFNVPVSYVFNGRTIYTGVGGAPAANNLKGANATNSLQAANNSGNANLAANVNGGNNVAAGASNNGNGVINTLAALRASQAANNNNPQVNRPGAPNKDIADNVNVSNQANANNQGVVPLDSNLLNSLLSLKQIASNSSTDIIAALNNQQSAGNANLSALLTNNNVTWNSLGINTRANAQNVQEFYDVNTNNALTLAEVQQRIVTAVNANNTSANNQNVSNNQNTNQNAAVNQNVNTQNTATVNQNANTQNANTQNANTTNQNTVNANQNNTVANNTAANNTAANNTAANNTAANNTAANNTAANNTVANNTAANNTAANNTATNNTAANNTVVNNQNNGAVAPAETNTVPAPNTTTVNNGASN